MLKKVLFVLFLNFTVQILIYAQTHIAVPLGEPVYSVLEMAQMRGLCNNLPAVKPYSREKILSVIKEIMNNEKKRRFGGLTDAEHRILEQFVSEFNPPKKGFDLTRGTISTEHYWDNFYFSGVFGFGFDVNFGMGYFPVAGGYKYEPGDDPLFNGAEHPAAGDFYTSIEIIAPILSFTGDLGKHISYGFALSGWIGKIPREISGSYYNMDQDLYYDISNNRKDPMTTTGEPLTYFPYTYKKRWDAFVFPTSELNNAGMSAWPYGFSIGYAMVPELAVDLFNGHLFLRFARIDREWAGMSPNASLVLNQSAQPFLAFETAITPFKWITISSLTGVLEYHNEEATKDENWAGVKQSSGTFQNAFSIVQLELNVLNYFYFGIGSSVVWPKRFEIGYIFPLAENFLYQNLIGDYDNMALFVNLKAQYPGLGKLWFSFYLDEISFESNFKILDRNMYAYQVGGSFNIPWIPFASLTASYTKNEPYNYTHNRITTPWYGNTQMEQNYVSFGKSLGHYIPPNSDEILVRFETVPFARTMLGLQYQMIRHGADYGNRSVDGSSLWSELPTEGERSILEKYFLRDGAYQWMHIVKLTGEYSLAGFKIPVKILGEMGMVYSYFTDIDQNIKPNTGRYSYSKIDTLQYPRRLYFIGFIGVKIFPK